MTTDDTRSIELQVEVPGTVEQVWQAIATGPGITAWFVPTEVAEEEGGVTHSSFGLGEGEHVVGRVQVWDPPKRVVFTGGDDPSNTMAFEWLVEARDGGSCVVRLVNSGFGYGDEWDGQYDGMTEGWKLFLHNLQLHLAHFAGQRAVPVLPMASTAGGRDAAWARLSGALGLPLEPTVGERVVASAEDAPSLAGVVQRSQPGMISLLLEEPAAGTGFVAVEGSGDEVSVSVWLYLYGQQAAEIAARDEPRWRTWLEALVA